MLLIFISILYLHFIFDLHFVDVLHLPMFFNQSHLPFDITSHHSVNYRRVFAPILYFRPSPSQSDSQQFHFQPFRLSSFRGRYVFFCGGVGGGGVGRYLLAASATVFYPQAFFTLRSFTDILTCVYQGLPGSRQIFIIRTIQF